MILPSLKAEIARLFLKSLVIGDFCGGPFLVKHSMYTESRGCGLCTVCSIWEES